MAEPLSFFQRYAQRAGQGRLGRGVAVDEADLGGGFGHCLDPGDERVLVGVGGVAGEAVDDGFGGHAAFQDIPARGALGLVADEKDVVSRVIQAVLEVIHNAAAGAHARAGDDDGWAADGQQALVVGEFFHRVQTLEIQRVVTGGLQGLGFPVPEIFHFLVQPGDLQRQGRVDEHRHARVEAVQLVDQLLGAAQGEGRNVDDAAIGQGMGKGLIERLETLGPVFVVAVPVGGLQDEHIAGVGRIRVRQNGGVAAAQIAGKGDAAGGSGRAGKGKLDKAGAQDVPGVFQVEGDAVFEAEGVVELESPGQLLDAGFHGADLPVAAVGKGHGVPEHGHQQGLGGVGADDLAAEAGIDEIRHPPDVVDVGMGEKQVIDPFRRHRPLLERQHGVMALGDAAVHQDVDTGVLDEVAGAGDAVSGAEVGDFHFKKWRPDHAFPTISFGSYSHENKDFSGKLLEAFRISIPTILPSSVRSRFTPSETSTTPLGFSSDRRKYALTS